MEEFNPTETSMKVHYACVQFYWTCYVNFDAEKSRGNKLSSSQFYVALKWSSSCQRFSFLLLKLLINFWLKIRKIKRSVNQKDLALIKSKRKKNIISKFRTLYSLKIFLCYRQVNQWHLFSHTIYIFHYHSKKTSCGLTKQNFLGIISSISLIYARMEIIYVDGLNR